MSQGSGPIASSGGPSLADIAQKGESTSATPFDDDVQARAEQSDSGASGEKEGGDRSRPQSAAQKRETKYARVKRQRAEFNAQRQAFEAYKTNWEAQARAAEESRKPKFDLKELKEFRERWKDEGNFELVEKADQKIAELEKEAQSKNSNAQKVAIWHQAEAELSQSDPDFLKAGTRLDTRLREIMSGPDGNVYRSHERGIVAAYHRARMELLQEDFSALTKENNELKKEFERVTGLTSISGGTPGRIGNGMLSTRDFSKLSLAEMRKRLAARAVNSVPWI